MSGRPVAPVMMLQHQLCISQHDLSRFNDIVPDKGRAENGVAIYYLLPGLLECGYIQLAMQTATELLNVLSALRFIDGMEEHSLLHRRQVIDVLYFLSLFAVSFRDGVLCGHLHAPLCVCGIS